jgi:hypothetical protein
MAVRSIKLKMILARGECGKRLRDPSDVMRLVAASASAYLRDLFTRLPQTSGESFAEFLPDRWLSALLQHRLELREREADIRSQRKRASRTMRRRALWHSLHGRPSA